MAPVETFDHIPVGVVTSGGTTTSDTAWTVTATTAFPAASGTVQFHVCDPAANGELILVTASPGGTGAGQSWTVVRGADSTTAVAHTAGFTIYQVVPASWLNGVVAAGQPLTTKGDLLYENATPALARLPIGTAGQVLAVSNSGLPVWEAAPVAFVNAVTQFGGNIQQALLSFGTVTGWSAGAGGICYVPGGFYAQTTTLIIPPGVRLMGDGWATELHLTTNSNCDMIQFEHVATQTTLSATISGTITSLPVNATNAEIRPGTVQVNNGTNTQNFTTTGAPTGATSIPVSSTSVLFTFTSGNTVTDITQLLIIQAVPGYSGVTAGQLVNAFYSAVEQIQLHGDAFSAPVAGYNHGICLTISPQSSAAGSDPAFDPQPTIRDVWIKAVTGDGIYHNGRSGAAIDRVLADSCNGNGFSPSFDTNITECQAAFCGSGFYMTWGSDTGASCKAYNSSDYTWVSGTSYTPGTVAVYTDNKMYYCILAVSGSTAPPSDPTHWTVLPRATSPTTNGYGYWFAGGEQNWTAVDSQNNSKGDYYLTASGITVAGSSTGVNTNNGQAAFNAANPNAYASVTYDGATGCTAIINSHSQSNGAVICTTKNSPVSCNLIAATDGTETAVFSGSAPLFALVNGVHRGFAGFVRSTTAASYTALPTDYLIEAAGTTGVQTITLPTTGIAVGQIFSVISLGDGANVHVIPASGQIGPTGTIHLGTGIAFAWLAAQWDGTTYQIIGGSFFPSILSTPFTTLDDSAGNASFGGNVKLAAGTTSLAPLTFQSGTNLTTATAGDAEYDGVSLYMTNETTSGRGLVPVEQRFRLTATGSNITTIANFFGTTSNISLVASAEYEIEIVCWFLKNTAGAVTWTFTNSAAPTSMTIDYQLSPATGIVTTAAATDLFGQQYNVTTTAPTVVSASLTTGVNHRHKFRIRLINGTGTSLKIQATSGAGSITPGINSYWTCHRVPAANVGNFAA